MPASGSPRSTRRSSTWTTVDAHARRRAVGARPDAARRPAPLRGRRSVIASRLHLVPRSGKGGVRSVRAARPVWVDDPDFDLDFHIRRAALPLPGGRGAGGQVQRVISRPLDRSKPLWEMYFIEGLEDGLVATLTKVHHAMIDGISGMDLATGCSTSRPSPEGSSAPSLGARSRTLVRGPVPGGERIAVLPSVPGADERRRLGSPIARPGRARWARWCPGSAAHRHGRPSQVTVRREVGPNRRFAMADARCRGSRRSRTSSAGR